MKITQVVLVYNRIARSKRNKDRLQTTLKKHDIKVNEYSLDDIEQDPTCLQEIKKSKPQVVFSFGGDGTLLCVMRLLIGCGCSFSGINSGNLGFLTDSFYDSFDELITHFAKGNYCIDNRIVLQARVSSPNKKNKTSMLAINDIILRSFDSFHLSEIALQIDGQLINNEQGDGVIVSTPTGSTAYSMSNGGPIITPGLDTVCITPISPHYLSHRPLVLSAGCTITMQTTKNSRGKVQLSNDGSNPLIVQPDEIVEVKKFSKKISLIYHPKYSYFHVLRKKLHWGR